MALTRLQILGYRGFQSSQTLEPAVPNGTPGSGLTIITGPNNSGKSSILECLRARGGHETPSFTEGTRNCHVETVSITFTVNGREEHIRSVSKGSSETVRANVDTGFGLFVLPSRRAFNPYFSRSSYTRKQFLQNSSLPAHRSSTLHSFEYRLFNVLTKPERFNDIVESVLGYKPSWTIDRSDHGAYFLKFFNGSHSHSSDGMGEGIISLFAIVDSLHDSEPGDMIVIDEPELSLHPMLQKRTASLLREFAKDRQLLVSTHSPYFVDLSSLKNGGHLARVVTGERGTQIHQLSTTAKGALKSISEGNINNPHVFGLDAKELFFQEENIILTEGQEDVILYPELARQVGVEITGNLFGWGAGGAGNFRHLCNILKALGFQRVAGLLDGDKAEEAAELSAEFPQYVFRCIPANDILSKKPRKAKLAVSGLLDERLEIEPQYREPMRTLFGEIDRHFRSGANPGQSSSPIELARR